VQIARKDALGGVKETVMEKPPAGVIKVQAHGLVIPFERVLKVVKCPSLENYLNEVLIGPVSRRHVLWLI
jgi:hypothetical protein